MEDIFEAVKRHNFAGTPVNEVVGIDYNSATSIGYLVKRFAAGDGTDNAECAAHKAPMDVNHAVALVESASFDHYDVVVGTPCTFWSDFSTTVGVLTGSNRALVGLDIVAHPNRKTTLEVYSPITTATHDSEDAGYIGDDEGLGLVTNEFGASDDRIMVVDCRGTCGQSDASDSVTTDTAWMDLPAVNWQDDQAVAGYNDAYLASYPTPASVAQRGYTKTDDQYCTDRLDITDLTVVISGEEVSVSDFTCHSRCGNGCAADDDNCQDACDTGYLGSDSAAGDALCVSAEKAAYICDALGAVCGGFDQMITMPTRYHLNPTCTATATSIVYDHWSVDSAMEPEDIEANAHCGIFDYTAKVHEMAVIGNAANVVAVFHTCVGVATTTATFAANSAPIAVGDRVTRTVFTGNAGETFEVNLVNGDGRRITDTITLDTNGAHTLHHRKIGFGPTYNVDFGISWNQVARFQDVTFTSAGTYKLCFCDSVRAGRPCTNKEDFVVEIGTIHASGVSCLLDDNKFRAKSCIEGYTYTNEVNPTETSHGALTCHDEAINLDFPKVLDDITVADVQQMATSTVAQMSSFCLYGPEENTRGLPLCQVVADYQSIAGTVTA